jgi:hypothetical protein
MKLPPKLMIATKHDEVLMSKSIRLLSALMALFFLDPVNSAQATEGAAGSTWTDLPASWRVLFRHQSLPNGTT